MSGAQIPLEVNVPVPEDFDRDVWLAQIDLEDFSEKDIELEISECSFNNNDGSVNNQEQEVEEIEDSYEPPSAVEAMKCLTTFRAYLQSSGIASGDDMLCLTRLENKVLKEHLAAQRCKKRNTSQSLISLKNPKVYSQCVHCFFESV